ncbi:MAG: hypothetical protein COV74_00700, partial [Candidatus Omnitrophica bacterium CG11_big_fil_rev_8_21_14_0_20_45_26]
MYIKMKNKSKHIKKGSAGKRSQLFITLSENCLNSFGVFFRKSVAILLSILLLLNNYAYTLAYAAKELVLAEVEYDESTGQMNVNQVVDLPQASDGPEQVDLNYSEENQTLFVSGGNTGNVYAVDTDTNSSLIGSSLRTISEFDNPGQMALGMGDSCDPSGCQTDNPCEEAFWDGFNCTILPKPDGTSCYSTGPDNQCQEGYYECQSGACINIAPPPNCDDGNPCTNDSCLDPGGSCQHVLIQDCQSCCDDSQCGGGTCDQGQCSDGPKFGGGFSGGSSSGGGGDVSQGYDGGMGNAGVQYDCDDNNPCTADSCDPFLGCVHEPLNGTTCDLGTACVTDAICQNGVCVPDTFNGDPFLDCDDEKPCTIDSCDPVNGCEYEPTTDCRECDDGEWCNGIDMCDGNGECTPGTPPDCTYNYQCGIGVCDENLNVCGAVPDPGAPCSNGSGGCIFENNQWGYQVCTGTCGDQVGECNEECQTYSCNDNNECTIDTCDEFGGCQHENEPPGTECSAGVCDANGNCVECFDASQCNDNDPCTQDECSASQCQHTDICTDPPVIETINNVDVSDNDPDPVVISVTEGEAINFDVIADDADLNDQVSQQILEQLPIGAGFTGTPANPSAYTFSWTPAYNQSGQYDLTAEASDGSLTDQHGIQIQVQDAGQYTLTVNIQGQGSVDLNPPGGIYDPLTEV